MANMYAVKTFLVLAMLAHVILGGGKDKKARKDILKIKKQLQNLANQVEDNQDQMNLCCPEYAFMFLL